MAQVYHDIVYPPKNRIMFDGGLNSKYDNTIIQDNESPDCLNVIFGPGTVETRLGSAILNTATVGTFACDGLYVRHTSTGVESMCAFFGGSMYVLSGTSFSSVPSATSIFTAGARMGATEYEDYLFLGNGSQIPYKYAGGEFTRHGVYAPTSAPTAASTAGSYLSGVYSWKTTYLNSNLVESDVGPESLSQTINGTGALLTGIQVAPTSWGVSARNIYRNETSGAIWYYVGQINNNTATTFVDNIPDADLVTEAPEDNGVPPKWQVGLTHQSRLFVIDPATNLVKYSEVDNPYVFKATSFIRPGDQTGDNPKVLAVSDNNLLIGCDESAYLVVMQDNTPANWALIKLKYPYGSKSPFATFKFNDRVFFAAVRYGKLVGFAFSLGDTVDPDATGLENMAVASDLLTDRIEPLIFDISVKAYYPNISAIDYKNRAFISVPYGSTATYNNRILYFDFRPENLQKGQKFAWAPWSGLNIAQFCVYNGSLYGADSDATGFIRQLEVESTYADSGSAINSYYWSKEFGGFDAHEVWTKDFRWLHLLAQTPGAYFMDMYTRTDSYAAEGDLYQINLDPGSSVFGTAVFLVDLFDPGKNIAEYKIPLGAFKGKRIQFKFTNQNTAGQKFKLVGMTLNYNIRGKR